MISSRALALAAALGIAALSASAAHAATLYADIAAYTAFTYSLTSEDRNPGSVVGTSDSPSVPYHFETPLTLDTPIFIHVAVDGVGQLGGFLGSFTLRDGDGASILLTNTQDWGMASAARKASKVLPHYETPVSLGLMEPILWDFGGRSMPTHRFYGPPSLTAATAVHVTFRR